MADLKRSIDLGEVLHLCSQSAKKVKLSDQWPCLVFWALLNVGSVLKPKLNHFWGAF